MIKKINIAVIPARSRSKRIKNKNIRSFKGKPMIYWPINAAKKSKIFDKIIVYTDSEKIKKYALKFGAEVPHSRDRRISDSHTGIDEVMKNIIEKIHLKNLDTVCCIFAATPFIKSKTLIKAFKVLQKNKHLDYVFSAKKIDSKVFRSFYYSNKGIKMILPKFYKSNSQKLKDLYVDAGQFYFGKKIAWLKKKKIFDKNSKIVVPDYKTVDIDTEKDFKKAYEIAKTEKR